MRTAQLKRRFKLGAAYVDQGYLFTTDTGVPLDATSSPNAHFHKIRKAAGLAAGARPYDLKHSGLSILVDAGASLKEVADRAGISVEVLLTRYIGSHPDAQVRLTGMLDRAFAR